MLSRRSERADYGRTLSRRGVGLAALLALVVSFLQSPGQVAADTKLDLTANPLGFLARALHLWTPDAPLGQIQNQAYGYFFPHGAFFALGELIGLAPWITQRLWWALLLTIGFVGVVRVAEALRIGSPGSRIFAAAVFVLSPRVLTTMGSISSETLPMMLAPWALLPVIRALDSRATNSRPLWAEAARSAAAVALMGAVNGVATLAALGVALLWWGLIGLRSFGYRRASAERRRWFRFGMWWAGGLTLACAWWLVPLLILSRASPPFLDFIESSRVTTQWNSLTEVLRGTSSWTPFVSPERVAGAVLVTQPGAVLATGALAAAGIAGLCMRRMPFRGQLTTMLVVGLLIMCVGYAGTLGSPIAEQVRIFLDGEGAFLRNLHKFEPLIRLPLVLGAAHLLARVPLPGSASWAQVRSAFAHPQRSRPVAAMIVLVVAVIGSGSLIWTGQLAPAGTYRDLPEHWQQAAAWLDEHSDSAERGGGQARDRTLVVPGAPFADQLWGLTRDEPLQPLAQAPWAVRDAIPLTPPGAIRALDTVQRAIANGQPSPGMASTLAQQGIRYVVLRADLDPDTSRSPRPLLAQHALDGSPGLTRVATFGEEVGPPTVRGVVRDGGLRPPMPAITIYAVDADGPGFPGTGPVLSEVSSTPQVAGGPEALAAVADHRARTGQNPWGPALLAADAAAAGIAPRPLVVTDTPTDREVDFGRVDDHSSAIRAPDDPRRTQNAATDYPVAGQPVVQGQWLLDNEADAVSVSTSGSAADATQPGQTSPANSAAAAFDGNPATAWVSGGLEAAVGKWMRLEFDEPRSNLAVQITTAGAIGPDVSSILVTTAAGSSVTHGVEPGEPVTVAAPGGPTEWMQIRAIGTDNGTAGNQFAIGELGLVDLGSGLPLSIRHRVVLPELPTGSTVAQWLLTQELSGRPACVPDDELIRCAPGLGLAPETPLVFTRALSVPEPTQVTPVMTLRPRPGGALDSLLAVAGRPTAQAASGVNDPRGNASALVDGDPATTWTAADSDSDDGGGDRSPRIVVTLPQEQRVERIRLAPPTQYPAAPSQVTVNLGDGPQEHKVGRDGVIEVDPAVTDRIIIRIDETRDVVDVNALGFASPAPAGISEIEISPTPAGSAPAPPDRRIEVGCDAGVGLTVSGQVAPMRIETTAAALRNGEPVIARPCDDSPIALAPGEQELSANPGDAFSIDSVGLEAAADASSLGSDDVGAQPIEPPIGDWTASHRTVEVESAGDSDRLLTVPESTNPGWQARIGDRELDPIVVNGWQQGWVVPAGESGTVTMTYRFDSLYRWSLLIGLAAMAVLLIVAAASDRITRWFNGSDNSDGSDNRDTDDDPHDTANSEAEADTVDDAIEMRPHDSAEDAPVDNTVSEDTVPESRTALLVPTLATVGWLGAAWLLTGWLGLAASLAVGVIVFVARPQTAVVLAFLAMMAATFGLTAGPWQADGGYHGFDWWVQLPAAAAIGVAAWVSIRTSWAATQFGNRLLRRLPLVRIE